jgi:hypothetical protein
MSDPIWNGLLSGIAGGGIAVASLGFWIKYYFGPYLSQKAKNLATHEDIQKLIDQVRETEQVKADISDKMWDRQARWTYKRDLYIKTIEAMTTLIGIEAKCRTVEELCVQDPEAFREWRECIAELMKVTNIASLVFSEQSNKILRNLRTTKAKADEPWSQEQTDRLKAHLAILRDEGRRDLGYAGPDEAT